MTILSTVGRAPDPAAGASRSWTIPARGPVTNGYRRSSGFSARPPVIPARRRRGRRASTPEPRGGGQGLVVAGPHQRVEGPPLLVLIAHVIEGIEGPSNVPGTDSGFF